MKIKLIGIILAILPIIGVAQDLLEGLLVNDLSSHPMMEIS